MRSVSRTQHSGLSTQHFEKTAQCSSRSCDVQSADTVDIDHLVAISRLTNALSRATSLDDVYAAALDGIASSLGVSRASILTFDENDFCGFVAWRGLSDSYRAAVNGHTPWRPDMSNPEPIVVPDVEADASLAQYADVFRREGIRALGFFPLNYRDRVLGKFMLYHAEPHRFDPGEIELAKTVAAQIAFGIARIRAEEEVGAERSRLFELLENVPVVVWETVGRPGIDQRVTFMSKEMERLTGYPLTDWYGKPGFWQDVIVNASASQFSAAVDEAVRSGGLSVHQYEIRRPDGSTCWVEVHAEHRRVGEKIVSRGFTYDISERKSAERRNLLLTQAAGVLSSSLDYEKTLPQFARLLVEDFADWCTVVAADAEGELRRLVIEHRDPATREAVEALMRHSPHATSYSRDALESGTPLLFRDVPDEFRSSFAPELANALERLGFKSLMVIPLTSSAGRIFGVLSIASGTRSFDDSDLALATDLGTRAAYAVDNSILFRQAQDANRAKDEFLATLSHELRTPMTATLGWATMLRMGDFSPDTLQIAIETIERSTRAQAKLIDEILDVSRIVTGKLQLSVAPVNLRSVIDAAVEAVRPSIAAKGIDLRLDLAPIEGVPTGDAERLQQVIWNLLSNSAKFTPSGGSIVVTLDQPSPTQVRISVSDTGQGIPKKFLPFIFERFRQADSSTTRAYGGLGLGLAIVRSIVDLHGGSVTAASDGEAHGSTFTITLPVTRATPSATPSAPAADATPLSLSGVSVLLVEDEDDTRRMLAAALQSFGASVIAVASAAAALDALRVSQPHVVVSDIGMPGEDGLTMIGKIRAGAVEPARNVPAIALSAYARAEDRERALASGFGYHLTKPVDPLTMMMTVRDAISPAPQSRA